MNQALPPSASTGPLLAAAFSTCMVVFALSAHHPGLVAARLLALIGAASCLALGTAAAPGPRGWLGDGGVARAGRLVLPTALTLWVVLGAGYRHHLGSAGLLPRRLAWFAVLAAGIGAAEEVGYRGFVQGSLRRYGVAVAVLGAGLGHTAYKEALFVLPPPGVQVDLIALGLYTLAGSLVLGLIREWSSGLAAPVLCHVLFDVIVYGDRTVAPPWVWATP